MTNEQLAAEIQAGQNIRESWWELCERNRGFLAKKARRWEGREELVDLLQVGRIALLEAATKYDPERAGSFLTAAGY